MRITACHALTSFSRTWWCRIMCVHRLRRTSKMPECPLIINEWYLNSYHCIIYWQLLSSPSGAVVPWHLTNSYVVGRRPFHLKADRAPGGRTERWTKAHTGRFHLSLLLLRFYNTTTWAWSSARHRRMQTHTCSCKAMHQNSQHQSQTVQ